MSKHTCVHMAVEARINLYGPSLDSVKLVFLRQGLSIGPRVKRLGEASWPVSPRDLSPQRLDYKHHSQLLCGCRDGAQVFMFMW